MADCIKSVASRTVSTTHSPSRRLFAARRFQRHGRQRCRSLPVALRRAPPGSTAHTALRSDVDGNLGQTDPHLGLGRRIERAPQRGGRAHTDEGDRGVLPRGRSRSSRRSGRHRVHQRGHVDSGRDSADHDASDRCDLRVRAVAKQAECVVLPARWVSYAACRTPSSRVRTRRSRFRDVSLTPRTAGLGTRFDPAVAVH